jgi:hypothetical protein
MLYHFNPLLLVEVAEKSPEFSPFSSPDSSARLVEDALEATDPVSHTVTQEWVEELLMRL